ncbi:conserved hypothetical protein [Microbacterium sp. 8M]|jgi:hypothetical protein|nr:conserved hypothetical protein [Microbacterium sp. 8M]
MAWTESTTVRRVASIRSGTVDEELILFSIETGVSHALAGTGIWIWNAIGTRARVGDVIRRATEEFGVPRDVCAPDIVAAMASLEELGLIAQDGAASRS